MIKYKNLITLILCIVLSEYIGKAKEAESENRKKIKSE